MLPHSTCLEPRLPATKYYARQARKYRKERQLQFKDATEVRRALEYLSRQYGLPYLDFRYKSGGSWSHFRPPFLLAGRLYGHFEIQDHHFDLYTVAHEFAHYVDYERACKDGRWKVRGFRQPYFRWHSGKFDAVVAECVAFLKRRLKA